MPMKEFFKKCVSINPLLLQDQPLLFRGAILQWPALRKWTNAYLTHALQDSQANNLFIFDKNYHRNRLFNHTAKSGFEQVLYGDESQRFYLTRQPLKGKEEKLLEDIQIPSWIKNKRFYLPNIWAGQSMSITPLHYDSTDGYLCQVAGYKRVYLFSPKDSLYLYPRSPLTGGQFNLSEITHVHQAPVDTHPHFLHANIHSILLGPGDTLYIPQGWWHQVFNLSYSVAVNFFFTNEIRGYSPKQEILIYQACKNSEQYEINKILNQGRYELCLQNALDLLEINCPDYACYFALTYFEEYLKAHFLKYFFSEFTCKDNSLAEELRSLAINLYNSRQNESKKYYSNLERVNKHLISYSLPGHVPPPIINKWISFAQATLEKKDKNIRPEEIRNLIKEIATVCVDQKNKSQQSNQNNKYKTGRFPGA
ncbi:MAG: hypothetical protein K0S27_481 [Gammaproteobacteria bacterium]|jgi:hypothetical protein|nr:hypothetical protein [Gammaproteobacteria bacterium]